MTLLSYIGKIMVKSTIQNLNRGMSNGNDESHEAEAKEENVGYMCRLFLDNITISCIGASIVVAAALIGYFEGWSFITTLYWCIITGTTVGYGDFSPTKIVTKWIAFFLIPCLVTLFGMLLARLSDLFVNREVEKINASIFEREVTAEDLAKMDADGDSIVTELEFVVYMLKELDKIDQTLVDKLHDLYSGLDPDSDGISSEDLKAKLQKRLKLTRVQSLKKYEHNLLPDQVVVSTYSGESHV